MSDVLRAEAHEWEQDEAVRDLLKRRPEFLRDDPDLMRTLGVRIDASNVIDFGPAALARFEQAHRQESSVRRHLEAVARANFDAQAQTHEAVIELLGARNHADLAWRLDAVVRAGFGLMGAVLALEGPERTPAGWRPLAESQVDLTLGRGKPMRLGVVPTAHGLFGAAPDEIGSVALIRLSLWEPARTGLLAIAAEDPNDFTPEMGHELLEFLARVVERTAERWPVP
jgi:uncharacterized protein YigA (DUF484 family)